MEPTFIWVPTDSSGPLGAFASCNDAVEAYTPYLKVRWSGLMLRFQVETMPAAGEEVMFLFAYGSNVPLFVAGVAEARIKYDQLQHTGVLEMTSNAHLADFGKMIPAARMRLDPLLQKTLTTEGGHDALNLFLRITGDIGMTVEEEIDALEERPPCPVASFIVLAPGHTDEALSVKPAESAEPPAEESAEPPAEESAERPAEESAEPPAEPSTESAEEPPTESAENHATEPESSSGNAISQRRSGSDE